MVATNHRPQLYSRVSVSSGVRSPLATRPGGVRPTPAPARDVRVYTSPGLTAREITVLKAWLDCDSKVDVGARLHIALGTVNTHLTRIRDKYSRVGRAAPTKAALVARALQDGIVKLDEL